MDCANACISQYPSFRFLPPAAAPSLFVFDVSSASSAVFVFVFRSLLFFVLFQVVSLPAGSVPCASGGIQVGLT